MLGVDQRESCLGRLPGGLTTGEPKQPRKMFKVEPPPNPGQFNDPQRVVGSNPTVG